LTTQLNEKIWALDVAESIDAKRDLAVEVAEARDELFQWNQRLNGPMSNTCEQMADDARLEYLTSCMVVNDKDERVWNTYDDYLKEKNQALALKARFEIMLYLQGLSSDFLEKTPEAQAMKEVENDVLAKAAEAAKALEAIEQEEKALAEKKTPKKRKSAAKKIEDEKEETTE
jgi:Holliday junction resolvase-like predicted endonuclease